MFFARSAAGAVSSALDALNALSSSKSSRKRTGDSQNAANPFELSPSDAQGACLFPVPDPAAGSDLRLSAQMQIMSALLDAQSQSNSNLSSLSMRSKPLKEWFAKIDGYGDGQITKSESRRSAPAATRPVKPTACSASSIRMETVRSASRKLASALKAARRTPRS
jgi:hypothetical protein